MTFPEAMQSLESLGTAQNRQIFTKHGYGPSTFGVSFANLEKLRKSIRSDHGLARELWASGNSDARILATMIADPAQATSKELDALVKEVDFYVLASLYSRFVAASKFAKIKMESWVKSKNDFISQTGWSIFALLVAADSALTDDYLAKVLPDIEKHIHTSKNRTRHAMNMAVVAIGLRNPKLQKLALASAARIGKVEVDHGETGCKTPDAAAYIRKAAARRS
jgi:3-methyladenine DNA glycosylase AlkD